MEEKQSDQEGSQSSKISLEMIEFFEQTISFVSSLANDPLFSVFVALYTLILLYFPKLFIDLIFSPILISTAILLSTLLRLGSIQRTENDNLSTYFSEPETETKSEACASPKKPYFSEPFLEWNVRAPLEVIYEEYGEGEEEEEEKDSKSVNGVVSLALYYPESDTGSSSDGDFSGIEGWDSPENICFRWEEEEKEGLIEIELDGKRGLGFQVEEDNLIEIEISPGRYEFSGKSDWKKRVGELKENG